MAFLGCHSPWKSHHKYSCHTPSQIVPLILALNQIFLGDVKLTSAHSCFRQKIPRTAYCLSDSEIYLFLQPEAYQYSWIIFRFANTSFEIAADSYFSYQKEAEVSCKTCSWVLSSPDLLEERRAVVSQYFWFICLFQDLTKGVSVIWFTAWPTSIFGSTTEWTGTSSQTRDVFSWLQSWITHFRTIRYNPL